LLEVDLRNYILEQQPIKDIINTRLYPGWIPKNAVMPSMAFFVVSNPSHHDINVSFPRIQFSIFSTRHSETKEISKFLKDSLNRFKGKLGNTDVIQIVYQNEYENYESDTGLYHLASDYKIIYWE